MSQSSKHYIDGLRFTELAIVAATTGDFADELIDIFYVLAKRTYNIGSGVRRHSSQLLEMENAVQEAVLKCFTSTPSFDVNQAQAYVFFRHVINNVYLTLAEKATREMRNPGTCIFNIENHQDIDHCNRLSYLMLESEKNHKQANAKLTQKQADEIRKFLAEGETGETLALEYGVSPSTISKIKHGKLWREDE